MCTLYAEVAAQEAIRRMFGVDEDHAGNLAAMPAIFPDTLAPVIRRNGIGKRALEKMRWGFPPPPNAGTRPVVNVRNTKSAYWRPWFKPEQRCLVPATSFCEWTDTLPKTPTWFALSNDRTLFAFAGIWRAWTGERGPVKDRVGGEHLLYSFLTTDANADVAPVHAKAMPVILREEDWDTWLNAPVADALKLQRPLPDGSLKIVAKGDRKDAGENS